jgi:hypothetical protein
MNLYFILFVFMSEMIGFTIKLYAATFSLKYES